MRRWEGEGLSHFPLKSRMVEALLRKIYDDLAMLVPGLLLLFPLRLWGGLGSKAEFGLAIALMHGRVGKRP